MRRTGTTALALLGLGFLAALLFLSGDASAVGEGVRVHDGSKDVVEGASVAFNVTFGANDDLETVVVDCGSRCEGWERSIFYNPDKPNCSASSGRRECTMSFPEGFRPTDGDGPRAENIGEPSNLGTYTITIQELETDTQVQDTFEVHLTSAHSCRPGIGLRSDVLLFTVSGIPAGEQFTLRVVDEDLVQTPLRRTFNSPSPHIVFHFLWEVPLDYPLGSDGESQFRVHVDSESKPESEGFKLRPGVATPEIIRQPGQGNEPSQVDRTEDVNYWLRYRFLASPPGCDEVSPLRRVVFIGQDDLDQAPLTARVNKIETTAPLETKTSTVDNVAAQWVPPLGQFWFNFTVPRDFDVTPEGSDSPVYELEVQRKQLADGNRLATVNSTEFRVRPYELTPVFEGLEREVERLETAEAILNITYADGSAFTPNDTNDDVLVDFGLQGESSPEFTLEANHREAGIWNVSVPLDFEYEPLGTYEWRVHETEDRYGAPNNQNTVLETPSLPVEVVGARPLITLDTFVGEEIVNSTRRTATVHASVHAEFKNGVPVTEDNVDPSLGGVVLNVKKTNQFGRVLDIDSFTMAASDDDGNWVRTFRVGRSDTVAPAGTWDLEVVARDNRDPVNENVTAFPFEVRPARLVVAPLERPPQLVEGGQVDYAVRLSYPDGSLFTEELADTERGGNITFQLERVAQAGQGRIVEETLRPRGLNGGQEWRVSIPADTIVPGNHYFNISGRDIYGNIIGPHTSPLFTVLFNGEFRNSTTPICPTRNATDGPCSISRGEEILALFPAAEGDTGLESAEPVIHVLRKLRDENRWVIHRSDASIDGEEFFNLTGSELGENHAGHFVTDEGTPLGIYRLFVFGRAEDETGFAGFSDRFNVTAITVDRQVITELPSVANKGEEITATLERKRGDVVDEVIARTGPVTSRGVRVLSTDIGTFVRWTPARTTPTGPATIEITGRDLFGNEFEAILGPVEIQPLDVRVQPREPPPAEAPRGVPLRIDADLVFPDGVPYTDRSGVPEVRIRDSLGEVVDTGTPRFINARWIFEWIPPPTVPEADYRLEVGGTDSSGNRIEGFLSRPFTVVPGQVNPSFTSQPSAVTRGTVAEATASFPTELVDVNATVTTGTDELGQASATVENTTVRLSFPTDRTTELVQARFKIKGTDSHGNTVESESRLFRINPQQMVVRFINQPAESIEKGERVVVDFVVEYPDGSRMRAGQGSPIVGVFAVDTPLGPLEARPLPENPTIFRIRWDPPQDARTDVPYRFAISAIDRWENTATPTSTPGFFVVDPLIPDYLPIPGLDPITLASLLAVAGAMVGRRHHRRT